MCGKSFSYEIGRGNDRKHCSSECRVKTQMELRAERMKHYPPCPTEGCNNVADRVTANLCDACYCRVRRNGTTIKQDRTAKYRYKTGAGYIKLLEPNHPLADSGGYVYEHRSVAHEKYGEGMQECHWCATSLEWSSVVIDHLNDSKEDNSPNNLVTSCNACNRLRGALYHVLDKLRPGALEEMFQRFKNREQRRR
jgi:hypothetical protein